MIPWKDSPWLLIDTETTGIDPKMHRVVELAMVTMQQGEPTDEACALLDPEIPIPAEASRIHGITDELVKGRPTMARAAQRIVARVKRHVDVMAPIVAYNAPFDMAMMREHCEGFAEAVKLAAIVDPLVVVRHLDRYATGTGRHKLETTCRRHGIQLDDAHSAKADAIACGRLLWALRHELPDDLGELLAQIYLWRAEQEREREQWQARKQIAAAPMPLHERQQA